MPCEDCQKDAKKLAYVGAAVGVAVGAAGLYLFLTYVKK